MHPVVIPLALFAIGLFGSWLFERAMTSREHLAPLIAYAMAGLSAFVLVQTDPMQGWLMKLPTVSAVSVAMLCAAVFVGASHLVSRKYLAHPAPVPVVPPPIPDSERVTAPLKPLVTITEDGPYLVVRNTGAPAMFRARLVATNAQEFPSVSVGSHFEGIWEATLNDKTEIATGDADRLLIGSASGDHDPNVTPFHFYDVATHKMGVRYARQIPDHGSPALSLNLTLVSVPAIAGGPKTYEIMVWQGRVDFLGEKPF
jgi:hypothetical protein